MPSVLSRKKCLLSFKKLRPNHLGQEPSYIKEQFSASTLHLCPEALAWVLTVLNAFPINFSPR